MHRFRTPELFLGCFLTVALFATGMLFVRWPYPNQTAQQISAPAPQADSKEKQTERNEPGGWRAWLFKDAAGFFTFGLAAIGVGQALLFFVQLRYMRTGMDDAAKAAEASAAGAHAAVQANKLNQENFLADHRPWLGPNGEPTFVAPFSPVKGGYTTAIEIKVINAGRSPALKVHVLAELYLMDTKGGTFVVPERLKSKLVSFSEWGWGSLIFPNGTTTQPISLSLTDEEVLANAITIGPTKAFYPTIWVGITYASSDGTLYSTSAIHLMRGVFIGMEIPASQLSTNLMHCEAT
jgi:hypothetical protein